MGIKIKLIAFFLSLFSILWGQQYEVVYKLDYQPDSYSNTRITEHTKLLINSKEKTSFFFNLGNDDIRNYYRDINERLKKDPNASINFDDEPEFDFAFSVYKDFTHRRFTVYEYVLGQVYTYEYPNTIAWELQNETKVILQYNCQKAMVEFGGRTWVAWFSNEIPISDGPYKFGGLPGIILEITSIDNSYHFIAETLLKSKTNIVVPKAIPMKEDKLKKYKHKLYEKPRIARQNMLHGNMRVEVKYNGKEISQKELMEEYEEGVFAWIKNHNNPIEKDMIWLRRD